MQISDVLNKLEKAKSLGKGEWAACCPAHADKKPSLHLTQTEGKILINCKAGCSPEQITKALGIELADLFIEKNTIPLGIVNPKVTPAIVAEYDYKDEMGNVLFQTVRYVPKDFRQRHRNGSGEWVWNLDGVRRVLYHLEVLAHTQPNESVYLVEGEKDADALLEYGLTATTSPMGANAWKPEYADFLAGKKVIIIPDNDPAGMQYARDAARSLRGQAAEMKVILLSECKDVSDWIKSGGYPPDLANLELDIDMLLADRIAYRTVGDLIEWDKKLDSNVIRFCAKNLSNERTGIHARLSIFNNDNLLSWSYFNIERDEDRTRLANAAHKQIAGELAKSYEKEAIKSDLDRFCLGLWDYDLSRFSGEALSGDETPSPISYCLHPYIVDGGGSIVFAPPGRGKSYIALLWAVSVDAGCNKFWQVKQKKVMFINLERSRESFRRRLSMVNKVLGLPATRPLFSLHARGHSLLSMLPVCRRDIQKHNIDMVVLDSISRAGLGDLNENQPGNKIIDTLSGLCPTWLALGHTSRANEQHMFGTVMQDAGADICVLLSTQVKIDDGILGIGLQITKQNDTGYHKQDIFALEFANDILSIMRKAKTFEFPDIEGKSPADMLTTILEWITNQDAGEATATEVENALGFTRSNVSRLFTQSGKFQQTRKFKQSTYYGVKQV